MQGYCTDKTFGTSNNYEIIAGLVPRGQAKYITRWPSACRDDLVHIEGESKTGLEFAIYYTGFRPYLSAL